MVKSTHFSLSKSNTFRIIFYNHIFVQFNHKINVLYNLLFGFFYLTKQFTVHKHLNLELKDQSLQKRLLKTKFLSNILVFFQAFYVTFISYTEAMFL